MDKSKIDDVQPEHVLNSELEADELPSSQPIGNTMLAEGLGRKDLILGRRKIGMSYRNCFGLENPAKGEKLHLKYLEGICYYLVWVNCPDEQNIIEGWFTTKSAATNYVKENGWIL